MAADTPNRLVDVHDDATPMAREVLDRVTAGRGRVPTPYKVWLHAPELAGGLETVGTTLNKRSSLARVEIEIVILSVAVFWNSPYVVANHSRHALTAGLPAEAVEQIRRGERPDLAGDRSRSVVDLVWAALEKVRLSDQAFASAEQSLGRAGIAEVLALIGYYSSVSIAMSLHEVAAQAG